MPSALKYVLDALAGAALVFALLVVFIVNYFMAPSTGAANTLDAKVIEDTSRARGKKLKIVVTPTQRDNNPFTKQIELWDDMGKMLDELGEGYKYDEIDPQQFLLDPKKLAKYDVMFLTCAGGGDTPEFKEMLQTYVGNGGILYASDWRYDAVANAFPDFADQRLRGKGAPQSLDADVVDPALREFVGKTVPLNFELGDWKPSAFSGERVQTLLQAKYRKMPIPGQVGDVYDTAPLMVRFKFGEGTVIFTSFHHEKKNSAAEKKLLQFLIFSLVTAGADAQVTGAMEKGGFTPQRSNLLSTPKENPKITKEYENKRTTTLRFGLGMGAEGATMRLSIKSPDKKREFSQEFKSTAIVEVPNAEPGIWTYTVERVHLPYENFPFRVTVGEKK